MELRPGDVVVHPQHGTATVVEMEERTVGGTKRRYVVLRHSDDDLLLRIPIESAEELGLRDTAGADQAERVLASLGEPPVDLSSAWQKRRAENERRIRSGDLRELAEVVRDLHVWIAGRDAPATDRRMLEEARTRMVNELADALGREASEVEAMIADRLP